MMENYTKTMLAEARKQNKSGNSGARSPPSTDTPVAVAKPFISTDAR